jgi:UTP--glucose-1-phosphate uridylyltransferase
MAKKIRKAVFPVAGLGTRFLPATKSMPKEMLPVVDKPLIQYAVEEAQAAGIEEFIFVNGRGKTALEDHFDIAYELEQSLRERGKTDLLDQLKGWRMPAGSIVSTRQQEPLGLGHAVGCARELVGDEPFAVLLPDDLMHCERSCVAQMVDVYNQTGGNVVAVMDVPREHTQRYGVLKVGADDGRLAEVEGLVEKPKPEVAPSTLSVIGRYILLPEVFEHLEKGERGAGGEIQLTDAMAKMIGRHPFHGYRFEGTRFDCGDKLGFLQATVAIALARPDLGDGLKAYLRTLNLG